MVARVERRSHDALRLRRPRLRPTACRRRAPRTARWTATCTGRAGTSTRSCAAASASTSRPTRSARRASSSPPTGPSSSASSTTPTASPPISTRRSSCRSATPAACATRSPGSCASACATTSRSPGASPRATPRCSTGSPRSLYGYANNSPVSYHDPGGTASHQLQRLRRPRRRRHLLLRPERVLRPRQAAHHRACASRSASAWAAASRPTSSRRRRRRRASPRSPSSTGRWAPRGGKVGGEFDLICGTGKVKGGAKLGPLQVGSDISTTRERRAVASTGGRQDRGQGRPQGLRGRAELIPDP